MPKGYAIARVSISDDARYADYRSGTLASLEPYEGRFIVRGGETECVEGSWDVDRTVVIEFPSMEQARAWYHSDGSRDHHVRFSIRYASSPDKEMDADLIVRFGIASADNSAKVYAAAS